MSKIEKLRALERSERIGGNSSFADNLLHKIAAMENHVPVQVTSDAVRRREVETAWSAIAPETIVDVLCVVAGVSRKVRKTMPMREAIHELKNGGWLVGRTDALAYPPQADTSNTLPLNQKPSTTLFW